MVSWEAWTTRYGADSSLVGRSVTLDGAPWTIIGVLPPGLRIDRTTAAPAFWVPALQDTYDIPERRNRSYRTVARLAPGATFAAATQEAAAIVRSVSGDTTVSTRVEQWQHDQGRDARGPLLLLLAAAGKSALVPFSGWLPRAMEGPTPSSAVFYGAISVHLGAFLLLRVSPILDTSIWLSVAVTALGLLTAMFGTLAGVLWSS